MSFEQSVDKLWDRLESDIRNSTLASSNWNYPEIETIMDELEFTTYWRKEIFRNFRYELVNIKRRPTRNIEWVDGCHAQLYDTFICKDCGCIIHTRDDMEECFDPLFCPVCNPSEKFTWAYDVNDGSIHYQNVYKYNMCAKEYHRKMNHWFWKRLINFKLNVYYKIIWKIKHKFLYATKESYRKRCDELFK